MLLLSPSNCNTTSTMCSSILGPAIEPSLVMWPMMKIDVPVDLAYFRSVAAHSRICDTLPADESRRSV